MCRHIAWFGPPRRLSELLLEPEHGLIVQSYAPRRQAHGRMNADGRGAGFFAAAGGGGVVVTEPYDDDPGWADVPTIARSTWPTAW